MVMDFWFRLLWTEWRMPVIGYRLLLTKLTRWFLTWYNYFLQNTKKLSHHTNLHKDHVSLLTRLQKSASSFSSQAPAPCIMCVQYIGGCSVHRECLVHGGSHEYIGGYHEYFRGYSVHWEDAMSTSGDIMMHVGNIMSTSGMFSTSEGYHEYIGGILWVHRGDIMSTSGLISWVHRGMFSTSGFSTEIERILSTCSPTCIMLSPNVLNMLRCIHDIPLMYSWCPPNELNIPRCTHGIPPHSSWCPLPPLMYSWYPPMYVLMVSPDILNTPWCTEHTYRVPTWYEKNNNLFIYFTSSLKNMDLHYWVKK